MKHQRFLLHFFTFCFVFFTLQTLEAQRYNFRSWSLDEGLPQSQIFDLLQDSRGILWMGTNGGGLSRFDGKKFETYTTDDGLINNQVQKIIEDQKGNLWIYTFGGLSKFDGQKFTNFDQKDSITVRHFSTGFEDKKGRIWYYSQFSNGNPQIGYFENEKYVNISQKYPKELHQNNAYRNTFYTNSGVILFDTQNGLYQFNDSLEWSPLNDLFEDSVRITPFFETSEHILFCAIQGKNNTNQLKQINLKTKEVSDFPEALNQLKNYGNANIIFEDSKGNTWFGMANFGAFRFDGKTLQQFTTKNGLAGNGIRDIIEDNEGNIWFGIDGDGLTKYTESPWLTYQSEHGVGNGFVWSILEHSDGNYWFGTTEGLVKYDGQNFEQLAIEQGKKIGILTALTELENGHILMGTYGQGLQEFDGKKLISANEKYGLNGQAIASFVKDDDTFYFFQNRNLIRYENEKTTSFTGDQPELNGFPSDIYKAKNGDIWICLNTGILRFDGKKFHVFNHSDGLKDVPTMQATEDDFGRIWFATYGNGLLYYDGKKFHSITKQNGLASNALYSITIDKTGNIWAGTQLGASKVSFKKNQEIKKIENFGKHDGFFGVETNGSAVLCDSKNNVWFGTIDGIQKYTSAQTDSNNFPPTVRIKEIQLFMHKTDWQEAEFQEFCHVENGFTLPQDLVLPYDKNHLTFRFESSNKRVPEKVRYQWKLAGVEDWTPITDKNEAIYAHLRSGFYVFHVRTMDDKGVWSKEVKYEFRITPPIWQRWWFLTFSFGGILGLVITVARMRMRHRLKIIEEQKEELERVVQVRTTEVRRQNHEILEKNAELEQQQEEILAQNDHINHQNFELHRKNEDITASINYAERIQRAILPFENRMKNSFPEHFILFKPRDIVSGDFYWFQNIDNERFIISALDCTGHGVPGAFMSMVGDAILNQAVLDKHIYHAEEILNYLNQGVRKALQQDTSGNRDGMDVSLCIVDKVQNKMQFAGAKNPLYYIQNNEMKVIKGDKMPIGGHLYDLDKSFTRHDIDLNQPTTFYIFSDGYQDQFGGEKQSKFMVKHFRKLLFEIHQKPMAEQHQVLVETLENWKGNQSQIDDILVIGGKI